MTEFSFMNRERHAREVDVGRGATRFCRIAAACAMALTVSGVDRAVALEGGSSPYLKGYRDFLTGIVPPMPGVYFRDDVYFYSGDISRTVLSGTAQATVDAEIVANIIRPTIVTPWQILGANYAIGLSWSQPSVSLSGTLTNPNGTLSRSASRFNIGDLVVTPAILGWHFGNWHVNASVATWIPVGAYDNDRIVNTGKNYWSVSPQLGLTYFDPQTGWDFSVAAAYVVNFENKATRYDSGDVFHIDVAVGKQVTPWLKLGVVGYAMEQVTADTGSGAILGSFEARVFGVGPAASVNMKVGDTTFNLLAKYYHEFGARNTFEGHAGTVSVSFKF